MKKIPRGVFNNYSKKISMRAMQWGEEVVDKRGMTGGEQAKKEVLDDIREKVGEERYRAIIKALIYGEYKDLSDEDKALIEGIKQERGEISH